MIRPWMSFYKLLRMFEVYQSHISRRLMTDSFTKSTIELFIKYLSQEKNQKQTTIFNNFSKLKTLLYTCHADGYAVNISALKNSRIRRGESHAIFLTIEELQQIEKLELEGTKLYIRDLFLVSCYTGLRYTDLIRVNKQHVEGNFIKITPNKTLRSIFIPVHTVIAKILNQYEAQVPSYFTLSYFNITIKHIASMAGISELISVPAKRGGKNVFIDKPKWKLISSRTGRRSFATNMYLAHPIGSVYPIMQITGHETEESFFRYICVSKIENAVHLLENHPFYQS